MTKAIELLKSALEDLDLVNIPVEDDGKEIINGIQKITIAILLLEKEGEK